MVWVKVLFQTAGCQHFTVFSHNGRAEVSLRDLFYKNIIPIPESSTLVA